MTVLATSPFPTLKADDEHDMQSLLGRISGAVELWLSVLCYF